MLDVFDTLWYGLDDPDYDNIRNMLIALGVDALPFNIHENGNETWYTAESRYLSVVIVTTQDSVEVQVSGAEQFSHRFERV
jgi:hypothetical protein